MNILSKFVFWLMINDPSFTRVRDAIKIEIIADFLILRSFIPSGRKSRIFFQTLFLLSSLKKLFNHLIPSSIVKYSSFFTS